MTSPDNLTREIRAVSPDLVAMRRELHQHPELGFKETRTAALIVRRLSEYGYRVKAEVGGTGVVGVLEGAVPGPTLAIRADIDALPVLEQTGLPFASKNGVMHACGHDGHISIALGAARLLASKRAQLRGRLVMVFQPAEEITQGALAMLKDRLFEEHEPGRVIGLHIWNQLPSGTVAVNRGTVFASADAIRITVRGRGGHGAMPHLAIDPVVAGAMIISNAQSVVSREVPPNEMGVLTFGQVHGGSAPNVIADEVVIEGTVRAYRPEVRQLILAGAERVASTTARALRAEARFERLYGSPPVVNNKEVAEWLGGIASRVVGADRVGEHDPVSVGDDMAEFLNEAPGCYFMLGASKTAAENHHNARFDFDEACLPLGVEVFARAAIDYLGEHK
ncbi:MAG: amidohydrolase [Chloroflexi bacterium]|nr:amidohydrolase [Chloroflexota bacterium]